MADLTITATLVAPVVIESQFTGPVAETFNAGVPVRMDVSTGKWTKANATTVAESKVWGICIRSAESVGIAPTIVRRGILDVGEALVGMAYGAAVYLSDTDGLLSDTPGTIRKVVGVVGPGWNSTTADKLLYLDCSADVTGVGSETLFIGVPLTAIRESTSDAIPNAAANGGLLASDTTPILNSINADTDGALRLLWAASNSDAITFQVALPPEFDDASNVEIHFRAAMAATNDTPTMASDVYFNEGDTKVEDASAAITGATYAEYVITVAAADVPAGAQTMTVELTPGAHTTDTLAVTAIWVEGKKA